MHDSSLDLFCKKAEEQANDFALTIEALAAALEVTVDSVSYTHLRAHET